MTWCIHAHQNYWSIVLSIAYDTSEDSKYPLDTIWYTFDTECIQTKPQNYWFFKENSSTIQLLPGQILSSPAKVKVNRSVNS